MNFLLDAFMRVTKEALGLTSLPTDETRRYYQVRLVHMCQEFRPLDRPTTKSSRALGVYARDSFTILLEMIEITTSAN